MRTDFETYIQRLKDESADVFTARNVDMDKLLKVEEIIDGKQEKINQLEKELSRKNDEIECRRDVIESMSASLMKHEKENRELVSKLVLIKNQILDNEIGSGSERTFGAVKLSIGSKYAPPLPVSVRFIYFIKNTVQNNEGKEQ